jgi:BirA family biotin operon repressor/biotin-[acetyl-CoA-carboxylase] ligase
LIENSLQGTQIKSSVIGIGLNINQEGFPPEAANAVSVKQILHRDYDLKFLLSEICKNIEAEYLKLKAGQFDHVRNEYLSRLYWLNEEHNFRSKTSFSGTEMTDIFNGVIKGVKPNGLLLVNNGAQDMEFGFKEIEFLNK